MGGAHQGGVGQEDQQPGENGRDPRRDRGRAIQRRAARRRAIDGEGWRARGEGRRDTGRRMASARRPAHGTRYPAGGAGCCAGHWGGRAGGDVRGGGHARETTRRCGRNKASKAAVRPIRPGHPFGRRGPAPEDGARGLALFRVPASPGPHPCPSGPWPTPTVQASPPAGVPGEGMEARTPRVGGAPLPPVALGPTPGRVTPGLPGDGPRRRRRGARPPATPCPSPAPATARRTSHQSRGCRAAGWPIRWTRSSRRA